MQKDSLVDDIQSFIRLKCHEGAGPMLRSWLIEKLQEELNTGTYDDKDRERLSRMIRVLKTD